MTLAYTGGTLANTTSDGRFYLVVGGQDVGLTKGGGEINHTFEIRDKMYDQYNVPLGFEVVVESFEFTANLAEVTLANLLSIMPGGSSLDGGATVGALGAKGTQLTSQEINIYVINEKPCGRIKIPAGVIFLSGPINIGEEVEDIVFPITIRATYLSTNDAGRRFVEYTTSTSTSNLIVASASPADGASVTSNSMPVVLTFNKVVGKYYRDNIAKFARAYEGFLSARVSWTGAWGDAYKTLTLTPAAAWGAGDTYMLVLNRINDTEGKILAGNGSTADTPYALKWIG